MNPEQLSLVVVFGSLALLIAGGAPIFMALGFASLAGMYLVRGMDGIFQLPASLLSSLDSFLLVAAPMYMIMGQALSKSGIGGEIYGWLEKLLYRIPGGLAVASIFACAVFGAMCGVSIAGVAAIGIVAVPEMMKRGYNRSFAAGAVTAAGGLAVLIPPSISFIIYGAIAQVPVGKLFIGGIIPGIVLAILMALYVIIRVLQNPSLAPRIRRKLTIKEKLAPAVNLWPVIFLIFAVLGTIYTGIATPTEAGGLGAAGALLVVILRKKANMSGLKEMMLDTTRITAMISIIFASAFTFGQYLNLVRLPENISQWVVAMNLSPIWVIIVVMILLIFLGTLLDGISMTVVTTPIILPTIIAMGFDPLWYGIILVLNIEIAVITPPVGLNLYAMKGAITELTIEEIIRGALPYVIVDCVAIAIFIAFPDLALWLPNRM